MQGEEAVHVLKTTASRIAFLLGHAMQRGMHLLATPCLAALAALPPLEAGELEQLVSPLAACQQQPELAAAVASVAPALARCPAPHAHVLQALLLQEGPLLKHLGMEAFCRYAQTCPPKNVVLAVPPALKDPGGELAWVARSVRWVLTAQPAVLFVCCHRLLMHLIPLSPLHSHGRTAGEHGFAADSVHAAQRGRG